MMANEIGIQEDILFFSPNTFSFLSWKVELERDDPHFLQYRLES
jgi:hypothetical protein